MTFQSINPYTGKTIQSFEEQSEREIGGILRRSKEAFADWRARPLEDRAELLERVGTLLIEHTEDYARTMTREMGKPISEARAEIRKCAWACDFYAENAQRFLADAIIDTDADESFISFDPLGTILAIMPWNYPFWQVFRFAAPTLTAGNVALLKHAPTTFGCARQIEELLLEAGYPKGVFQNLIIDVDKVEDVIEDEAVKGVTLTGSERAGSSVASLAGKNVKKTVLELGGSNAFIVLEDADLERAVKVGVQARMMNTGQSCIAAKRFILHEEIYDVFVERFIEGVKARKSGDPMKDDTEVGPLAREDLAETLHAQVHDSIEQGAALLLGGGRDKAYHQPTVLENVEPGMRVFDEETFGPVASMIKAKNVDEAFVLAGQTKFGLGCSLFTEDIEQARRYIPRVHDGALFINDLVKSDPRLPFGGTRHSGYGRELSREGMREFVNKKTVYIRK